MILPEGFDLDRPDDELIDELVASGAHTRQEAEDLVGILRDGEPVD